LPVVFYASTYQTEPDSPVSDTMRIGVRATGAQEAAAPPPWAEESNIFSGNRSIIWAEDSRKPRIHFVERD